MTFLYDFIEEAETIKKPRGKKRNRAEAQKIDGNFQLKSIYPKTENQKLVFEYYSEGFNLLLHGCAGTGKTFISLYLALKEVLNSDSVYKKIAIVRSAVPTRDIGFLPGSAADKMAAYELPYVSIFAELFGRRDAYEIMKTKKIVEFIPTSYIRGRTLEDTIIIVDEYSNLNFHENDSIITRLGDNSKIIFCGDYTQSDFAKSSEREGIKSFNKVLDSMRSVRHVEFYEEDIVRSGLVREYIITKNRLGIAS